MRIDILTLFPEMFAPFESSVIGRAQKSGVIDIVVTDIRAYSKDKHSKCDDYPFGGGAGMVMTPQPIYDCVNALDPEHKALRLYMSPKGEVFTNAVAKRLAGYDRLLILCGHYEGVDQRVLDLCFDGQISIGDFVLTGGEIAAMAVCDATLRYVDGVLGSNESVKDESFSDGALEYPQYTRPAEFMGISVPEVLLSGNHALIDEWRKQKSIELTQELRPDLLDKK